MNSKSDSRRVMLVGVVVPGLIVASATLARDDASRAYTATDMRGTWTYSGWVEATLLIPLPAQFTDVTPPAVAVNPGDRVSVKGALVGLFEFDGRGSIDSFQDLFKAGGIEPISPPFPLPFLPAFPEQGRGTYTVNPDGTVTLNTLIVDPMTDSVVGEADYECVLNRAPRQLDCIFSRFKTYVVDPSGFDAPIVGQVTLRPQR